MQYHELNVFNQTYMMPLSERRDPRFLPREEIADPRKIYRVLYYPCTWDLFQYNESVLYRSWIPWRRSWNSKEHTVQSTGVYVLSEHPSMFSSMRELLKGPMSRARLVTWLDEWWSTPWMISSPLFSQQLPEGVHATCFVVNNRYPVQRIPILSTVGMDVVSQMIAGQAYTMCNGLTLVLALHRLELFPKTVLRDALTHLLEKHHGDLFQPVSSTWEAIYYSHPTPHVADLPWLYSLMGTRPCHPTISRLFQPDDDSSFVIGNAFHGAYFSHHTVTLPTLHVVQHPHTELQGEWLIPSLDLDEADSFVPDIPGFVLGITRTRANWQWWCQHHPEYLHGIAEHFASAEDCLESLLRPVLHFYVHAKDFQPRLCFSKLKHLWRHILNILDPEGHMIGPLINRWMIKRVVIAHLRSKGHHVVHWLPSIPYFFLQDVFERCTGSLSLGLYEQCSHRVYTHYHDDIADLPFVIGRGVPGGDRSYSRVRVSSMAMFQNITTGVFHEFYLRYVCPRITSRLLGIEKGFGIREHQAASLDRRRPHMHLIGSLVLEWVRENRDALIH
jgi:hypothetical protein